MDTIKAFFIKYCSFTYDHVEYAYYDPRTNDIFIRNWIESFPGTPISFLGVL